MRQHWFLTAILSVCAVAAAQQPKVINAQLHTHAAEAGLAATVSQLQHETGPQWIGYAVPAVPGSHFSTCSGDGQWNNDEGCCGVYRLENADNTYRSSASDQTAQTSVDILVRLDKGDVNRIRFTGGGCQIDAGGLPFTWITDVK